MNDQQILEIFAKLTSPSYYGKGKNYMRLKWAMSAALTTHCLTSYKMPVYEYNESTTQGQVV